MILGSEKMAKATVDEAVITLRGLDETDVYVLASIAEIKERAYVQAELLHALDKDGTLRITFDRNFEGLYLPFFHPLMQKAMEISYQSFFSSQDAKDIPAEVLSIRGKVNGVLEHAKFLVLTEFEFKGRVAHERKWVWWCFDNQKVWWLDKSPLEEIWMWHKRGDILVGKSTEEALTNERFPKEIKECYNVWVDKMRNRDESQFLMKKEAEIQRYHRKLGELRHRLQQESSSSTISADNLERMNKTQECIDELVEALKQLESESLNSQEDAYENIRTVAVFSFE